MIGGVHGRHIYKGGHMKLYKPDQVFEVDRKKRMEEVSKEEREEDRGEGEGES